MAVFILTLLALGASAIAAILWLAGRWERGRPSNEALGVPPEVLRQLERDA